MKAKIIDYLREAVKPKQIQIFPKDLVFDGEREILERAVILNWMKQWLTWLSWYHTVALSPDVTIDHFHAFLLSNMSTWGDAVGGAEALLTGGNAFYSAFDSMIPVSLW